jgi:CRP/FNR family transcriptional regulator, cyclic AMP receptor protein
MTQTGLARLLLIEKVLILKSLNIFRDTPENILAELAPLMHEIEYEKNIQIFAEGQIGDCMYIIHQGEVKIQKGETILALLKSKEVFGELSLLDSETRSASASTTQNSILFRIDQEPFYELIESRPEVARGFIKMLCQRLRAQNERSVQSTQS